MKMNETCLTSRMTSCMIQKSKVSISQKAMGIYQYNGQDGAYMVCN